MGGVVIFLVIMFVNNIFSGDVHLNVRGFVQLISALLEVLR